MEYNLIYKFKYYNWIYEHMIQILSFSYTYIKLSNVVSS
jgi:hypothetical protein